MLYGSERTQQVILQKAGEIARDKKMVFGVNVGSASQGFERYDSDYDIRFLYYNSTTPDNSEILCTIPEDQLIYRHMEVPFVFYDRIAFWDITAFLHFLHQPQIEGKFSSRLYNLVPWAFLAPNVWDPYGISGKIVPLMNHIFNSNWAIQYYRSFIEEHLDPASKQVELLNYLLVIRAAMSIEWIQQYHTFAPIHISTLLAETKCQMLQRYVPERLSWLREQSMEMVLADGMLKRQKSHFITTSPDPDINSYVMYVLLNAAAFGPPSTRRDEEVEQVVSKMLSIVLESMRPRVIGGV